MSDTPETDKAERMAFSGEYMVPTEFARQLERERDETRKALVRSNHFLEQAEEDLDSVYKERDEAREVSEVFSALAWKLEGERNKAREVLREIAEASHFGNIGNWARNKAKEALK